MLPDTRRDDEQLTAYFYKDDGDLWYERLGHRNMAHLRTLGTVGFGVLEGLVLKRKCDACEMAKHTRHSFSNHVEHRAKEPLELVHTDVVTVEQESLGGARYAVLFSDVKTRHRVVRFMRHKSEVLASFEDYQQHMKGLLKGAGVKAVSVWGLRSDNGGEYTGQDFQEYCRDQGILQTFNGPYAPEQNGVTERS